MTRKWTGPFVPPVDRIRDTDPGDAATARRMVRDYAARRGLARREEDDLLDTLGLLEEP